MATVAIVINGVMKSHTSDSPIRQGTMLYHAFINENSVALITDDLTEEKIKYWCEVHGFNAHNYLVTASITDPISAAARRLNQLSRLRKIIGLDMVIEPDPSVAAAIYKAGIPVMQYLHPQYAKPEHRPDYDGSIRPWAEMTAEVVRTVELKAYDPRELEVI